MKKETLKKIAKIVGDVLFGIVLVFLLFIAVVNLRAKSSNGLPNMFGTGYLSVLTDSMDGDQKDSFKSGDLVVVDVVNDKNRVDKALTLNVGQIITYYDYSEEKIISHRIIEIESQSSTGAVYVVKGDSPYAVATTRVGSGEILGVYKRHIKGLGKVFDWVGHGVGFFIVVVLPCILFLLYEVYRFIRVLLEYNKEKNSQDTNEKQIENRKKALDSLVADGTITQEQADAKLQEYIKSLTPEEETPVAEEEKAEEAAPSEDEKPTEKPEV